MNHFASLRLLLPVLGSLALSFAMARAQAPATGAIEGRVLNVTSGAYLNNARVAVSGTRLEAFTNESGEFRLFGVPAGEVQLAVGYTGLEARTFTLTVPAGGAVRREIELGRASAAGGSGVVQLDRFVVASQREENAAAIASHEQRVAPNLKSVVAADAFGDIGEGNLGEFIKFVPGVVVNYSGFDARTISVRGLPSSTTPVLVDGNRLASAASSGVTRDVEVGGLSMSNIARVEVSKSPTPDSPADSMGGTVNVINKGAFDRSRPQFTYRAYAIMNSEVITLKKLPGSMPENSVRRVLPGLDFSYIAPFSKTFGITFNGFYTQRYSGTQQSQPIWRPANGGSNFGTAERPFLNGYTITDSPTMWHRVSVGTTLDWKSRPSDVLTFSTQYTATDVHQGILEWTSSITGTSAVAPAGYDRNFVQSAPGAGSSIFDTTTRRKMDATIHSSVKYRHNGPIWKVDGGGYYSHATNRYRDIDRGHFESSLVRVRNLTLRYSDINTVRFGPGTATATTTAGAPVPLLEMAPYSLQTVGSTQRSSADTNMGAHLNVRRDFLWNVPFSLRAGGDMRRQDRDIRIQSPTWTFIGPDGAANTADDLAARYDVIDFEASKANTPFHLPHIQRISPYKMWALYQRSPHYFRLDEAAQYIADAGNSRKLVETISSGYLRGDLRLFNNRLGLVGGVRFEQTEDDGHGRLNDVRAIYQQDANGNLILDANRRPIRISTNALTVARLQYQDRGAHGHRRYGNFYPSLNASYAITENLQARATFARTIGRPNLNDIIPNITVADPTAPDATRTITVVNTGLKPWTADNFDVSLERYFERSGRVAIGAFQKSITDFFGATRTPATLDLLELYDLSDDYLGYDVVSRTNVGDARITGVEFDYHQPLTGILPKWASGVVVFFNTTKTHLQGSNSTASFSGFTKESTNWGVSLARRRFDVKLTWNFRGRQRLDAITGAGVPPGTYLYNAPYLTLNVNAEYRLSRRLSLYGVARNIANRGAQAERYGAITPNYARISNFQRFGSQISVGMKGEF